MFKRSIDQKITSLNEKNRKFYDNSTNALVLLVCFILIDAFCNYTMIDKLVQSGPFITMMVIMIVSFTQDIIPAYLGAMSDQKKENRVIYYGLLTFLIIFFIMLGALRISTLYDGGTAHIEMEMSQTGQQAMQNIANNAEEVAVTLSDILFNLGLTIMTILTSIASYFVMKPNREKSLMNESYNLQKGKNLLIKQINQLDKEIYEMEEDLKTDFEKISEQEFISTAKTIGSIYSHIDSDFGRKLAAKENSPEAIAYISKVHHEFNHQLEGDM